jgi:triacylglycerol lipase
MASVSDLATRVAALGDEITPELIAGSHELYAGLHPPADGVRTTRDLAYGPDPRHLLDVHVADDAGTGLPVLVFVHGGGFVGGAKSEPGSPYYDNIGRWAARAGFVGVTIEYRLAPHHVFPAGAEDVGSAVAWLRAHVAEHGGDPDRIVLMGQSAGASHVAGHVALHADGDPGVRAVILVAGAYDLVAFDRVDIVGPYYGEDPAGWEAASALPGLVASGLPVMVSVAEYDPDISHLQTALAIEALFARDERVPHVAWLPGHNHITEVLHIGTGDEVLGDHVRRFVAAHT